MAISSINFNNAALLAQLNIGNANTATANDVAALSSGNRIVSASTDVAALAAGTALISQVNTLNTALANASQGSSLLQVADGALAQVQTILQRQQAIATSAQSGSLSATQRGFLDQEFQALTLQIDLLATSTNFNGVNLIDGSLAGSNPLRSAVSGASGASIATVSGFTASGTLTGFTSAVNVGGANDTSFYGALNKGVFTVSQNITTATSYSISYSINGSTYQGVAASGATTIVLSNGKGTLTIATTALAAANGSATNPSTLQTSLTTAFAGATAFAIHTVATQDLDTVTNITTNNSSIALAATTSSTPGGTNNTSGTLLAGFSGAAIAIQSAFYSGNRIPSISGVTATTSGGVLTGLSILVNGQTYSTQAASTGGGGNGITAEDFGGSGTNTGIPIFFLNGDTSSKEKITFDFTTITADTTDLTTQNGVDAFVDALNKVLGQGGSGLQFQVGSSSDQSIGITIGAADSSTLFSNVTQNVLTQASATTAANAVQVALNTVTALRAGVGANEERFNFASNAIQSAAQNQGAAKSALLDTDVAAASTQFATHQVQVQAGIAVLAQANQLQQNLLKLIA